MKTANEITRTCRAARLALGGVLLAAVAAAVSANAQYQPAGDDGIAASPKVRAQIEERKARLNPAPAPAPIMACPKCVDEYTRVPATGAKGAQHLLARGARTQLVAKHLCPGCDTSITVTGTGKGKQNVAIHKCSSCGAENLACCGAKRGEVATKGMEQKPVEIAPVK